MFQHQTSCSMLSPETGQFLTLAQDCRSSSIPHDNSKVPDNCRHRSIQTEPVWWTCGDDQGASGQVGVVDADDIANQIQGEQLFSDHMLTTPLQHTDTNEHSGLPLQSPLELDCNKSSNPQDLGHQLVSAEVCKPPCSQDPIRFLDQNNQRHHPPNLQVASGSPALPTALISSDQQNLSLPLDQHVGSSQWLGRRPRSTMKRRRRHAPGSCIDLTHSDEEVENASECVAPLAGGAGEQPAELHQELQVLSSGLADERWSKLEGKVCKYPDDDDDAMAIHGEEVRCLAPGAFLNDTIVEFHIRWLQVNWSRHDLPLDSCLFLNSFFYKKLKQLTTAQRLKRHPDGPDFQRLRRWTRGINLLRKQYIFVPIHDAEHWTLAVICFPEERALPLAGGSESPASIPTPVILHFDSLGSKRGGHATANVTRQLKSYLAWEVLQQLASHAPPDPAFSPGTQAGTRSHRPLTTAIPSFAADKILVKRVPVPLQTNDFDCGLFLLHNLETFITIAPATFRVADLNSTLQLGRNWYLAEAPSLRRTELLRVLEPMMGVEEEALEAGHVAPAVGQSPVEAEHVTEGHVAVEDMAAVEAGCVTGAHVAAEPVAASTEVTSQPAGPLEKAGLFTPAETEAPGSPSFETPPADETSDGGHSGPMPPVPASLDLPLPTEGWPTDRGLRDRSDAATTEHASQSSEAPSPGTAPCAVPTPPSASPPLSSSLPSDPQELSTEAKPFRHRTSAQPANQAAQGLPSDFEPGTSMLAIQGMVDNATEGLPAGGPDVAAFSTVPAAADVTSTPADVVRTVVDVNPGTRDVSRPSTGLKRKAPSVPNFLYGVAAQVTELLDAASGASDVLLASAPIPEGKTDTVSSAQDAGDVGISDGGGDAHGELLGHLDEELVGGCGGSGADEGPPSASGAGWSIAESLRPGWGETADRTGQAEAVEGAETVHGEERGKNQEAMVGSVSGAARVSMVFRGGAPMDLENESTFGEGGMQAG